RWRPSSRPQRRKATMRVAFYARVSTERQQHAQTIEQQVAQLRAYAAAQDGWLVDEEHLFRDDGYSGAKLDRPALDALRDQAARAAFGLVLVAAPDRRRRGPPGRGARRGRAGPVWRHY